MKSIFNLKISFTLVERLVSSQANPKMIPRVLHSHSLRRASTTAFPRLKLDATAPAAAPNPDREAFEKATSLALAGGGKRGASKHVGENKKVLPRDRVASVLDPDSPFLELSLHAGLGMDYGDVPAAGMVAGIGAIHDRLCLVTANDATVKGGTMFPISVRKQLRAQEIALQNSLPCVYVIDSGGAFLPLQSEIFNPGGRVFYNQAVMSAKGIPQLALVCGSCTAGAAYLPTMSDESIIVKAVGHVFLGGPPLVKAALGETVSAEELGGADLHCRVSGCTDHYAETEEEAFSMIRSIVASLNLDSLPPPSLDPLPPASPPSALASRNDPDFYEILISVVDDGRFQEFRAHYGDSLLTRAGFAHLNGRLVGIIGFGGPVAKQDAIKGCHFVQICAQRDIPLIVLACCDGKAKGESNMSRFVTNLVLSPEDSASDFYEVTPTIRAHSQLMTAFACSGSPVVTVATGCNSDVSAFVAAPPASGPRFYFAWPQASPPIPGLLEPSAVFHAFPDVPEDYRSKLEGRLANERTALHASSRCWIDGVIAPEETRTILSQCLDVFAQAKSNKILFSTRERNTLLNLKF